MDFFLWRALLSLQKSYILTLQSVMPQQKLRVKNAELRVEKLRSNQSPISLSKLLITGVLWLVLSRRRWSD